MSDPRLSNDEDLQQFCAELELWLKPHSKMTVTVTLPTLQMSGAQCISTWEVMDKLKKRIRPNRFAALKVVKSNIEFIRLEAECHSRPAMDTIVARLDRQTLKLAGFAQTLTVRAAKVKIGSTRHEWESYFRDNPNMNEMKPGYRPDTIHLQNLPVKWLGGERPNPNLLVKVFGVFGEIRRFHIPVLDSKPEEGDDFKRFSFNETLNFEAYVQYRDYVGFVKAMDALRGMKLVKYLSELENQKNKYIEYDMKVDFDRTKHLSDKSIKKRRIAREYGVKSALEVKKLREESKKQRQLYLKRIKLLKERKDSAKLVLQYLLSLAQNKAILKKQEEHKRQAEQKLKERLLEEEVKLRQTLEKKYEERKLEFLREKAKGKLKSVANLNNHNSNNNKSLHSSQLSLTNRCIDYRQNHCINQMKIRSSLYKNHVKGCKYYKTKSIVVQKTSK